MEQEPTDKMMQLNDEFEALYFNDDDLREAFNSSTYQIEAEFAVEYLAKKEKQIKEFRIKLEKFLAVAIEMGLIDKNDLLNVKETEND